MSLKICSLSSGSSGNCIFVSSEKTKLIIDAGIAVSKIEKSLSVLRCRADEVQVLLTHTHSDHVSQIPALVKKHNNIVHSHFLSADYLEEKNVAGFSEFGFSEFSVGDIKVMPFRVSHDVPCVGFQIYNRDKKISVLTDLGRIDSTIIGAIGDSDVVFIEANHDEALLKANNKYAHWLKQRILSTNGHLSNAACADACLQLAKCGVKQIILGHLSIENNYPELAFNTICTRLAQNGFFDSKNINIEVAPADRLSGLYEVC